MRSAQDQPFSGIARFTRGLARGLLSSGSLERTSRVILVGYEGLDLSSDFWPMLFTGNENLIGSGRVHCYPLHGLAPRRPRFLWSDRVSRLVASSLLGEVLTPETITWIAPDNIDGPVFTVEGSRLRVVQIVHDLIPLSEQKGGFSPLAFQLRHLCRRRIRMGQALATVSTASASQLSLFFGGSSGNYAVIRPQLEAIFCDRVRDAEVLANAMADLPSAFLSHASEQGLWSAAEADTHGGGAKPLLILGIGRDEEYKRWGFAAAAAQSLTKAGRQTWFVHVGAPRGDQQLPAFLPAARDPGAFDWCGVEAQVFPAERVVSLRAVSDEFLAALYCCADLLVHPSKIEGYGYTLAEAYVAGMPVVAGENCGFWDAVRSLHSGEAVSEGEFQARYGLCIIPSQGTDSFEGWYGCLERALGSGLVVPSDERKRRRLQRLHSSSVRRQLCDWESSAAPLFKI